MTRYQVQGCGEGGDNNWSTEYVGPTDEACTFDTREGADAAVAELLRIFAPCDPDTLRIVEIE